MILRRSQVWNAEFLMIAENQMRSETSELHWNGFAQHRNDRYVSSLQQRNFEPLSETISWRDQKRKLENFTALNFLWRGRKLWKFSFEMDVFGFWRKYQKYTIIFYMKQSSNSERWIGRWRRKIWHHSFDLIFFIYIRSNFILLNKIFLKCCRLAFNFFFSVNFEIKFDIHIQKFKCNWMHILKHRNSNL